MGRRVPAPSAPFSGSTAARSYIGCLFVFCLLLPLLLMLFCYGRILLAVRAVARQVSMQDDLWPLCDTCVCYSFFFFFFFLGEQNQSVLSWEEGRPCPFNGGLHGDRLPVVLDAIRCCGDARLLWKARRGVACCQFDPVPAGKDQHRPQPCYLCAAQQAGTNVSL